MTKSVKNMFSVLMDAITDANMIADYSMEARQDGNDMWADWFREHAMKRVQMVEDIYDDVSRELNMERRIRENDEIAYALDCYLKCQMDSLDKKMNML